MPEDQEITQDYVDAFVAAWPKYAEPQHPAPPKLPDHAGHLLEVYIYANGRVEMNRPSGLHCRKMCTPQEAQLLESFIQSIGTLELCQN